MTRHRGLIQRLELRNDNRDIELLRMFPAPIAIGPAILFVSEKFHNFPRKRLSVTRWY